LARILQLWNKSIFKKKCSPSIKCFGAFQNHRHVSSFFQRVSVAAAMEVEKYSFLQVRACFNFVKRSGRPLIATNFMRPQLQLALTTSMAYGVTGCGLSIPTGIRVLRFTARSQEYYGEDATPRPCCSSIDTCRCDRLDNCVTHWWSRIRSSSVFDQMEVWTYQSSTVAI
jgi:hypothetical protein